MLVVSELSNHHDGDMFVKQPAACWTLMPWNRGSPFHTDPRCRQGGGSITSLTSLGETTDETNWEKDAQRRNHAIIKHQKKSRITEHDLGKWTTKPELCQETSPQAQGNQPPRLAGDPTTSLILK